MQHFHKSLLIVVILFALSSCKKQEPILKIKKNDRIVLLGNNLPSRMINYGLFETEIHSRFPDSTLFIRNMGDGGNTPGFRPHSGRDTPWAFSGAEQFQPEHDTKPKSNGFLEYPDEWLSRLDTDIIVAFFGFTESFKGADGISNFSNELQAFIDHTKQQKYNSNSAPKLVLVSPIAYEDISDLIDVPNGVSENKNLSLYTEAIKKIALDNSIPFIDAFNESKNWYTSDEQHTIDGLQLNETGYEKLSNYLANQLFGATNESNPNQNLIKNAVNEKNWFWHNDFKIPNGVHVFGRRYDPFGPDNYPFELKKIREMTAIRDTAIWMAAKGIEMDLKTADSKTSKLPSVETNYKTGQHKTGEEYLYGQDALDKIHVAEGYKVELFASETDFPDLANPVQLSFDDKGRLWVAVMPTYPHYKPGDSKPNDKLIILEDTDKDGKADKQIIWADNLHIPVGFELSAEGVYVSQGTNLILLSDTDGDDKADKKEILLSGFDDHDTHHVISAFCADPSGSIFMGEGVFLHTNVETAYGTVRGTAGGFYRYNPKRHHLERNAQIPIPNPWGIAFDDWGQNFYLETSGTKLSWMMPSSIKPAYGLNNPKSKDLVPKEERVRPTSGLEFVSSSHFPEEVQGDVTLCNSIGFLGIKQHKIVDDGTGYKTSFRQDLMWSDDKNFRPVDLEFAPDGSLYVVDWHNILVGHMQHNARDPLRDHAHGRIYRITYPSRPLVKETNFDNNTPINDLLESLKLPEYRTRYRAKRVLRGRDTEEVSQALKVWVKNLDTKNANYSHNLLEALWVSWGINKIDNDLLQKSLTSEDHRVRSAAVRAVRYNGHQLSNQYNLLKQAANDKHGRVRLEAIVAGSWLDKDEGQAILNIAAKQPLDDWMLDTYLGAQHRLTGKIVERKEIEEFPKHLAKDLKEKFHEGKTIYHKEGFCSTCHQPDGKGLSASGFPPLANSEWVLENEERLIKLTLKGLHGPIKVLGKDYPGQVPMTPFEGMLDDEELAAVLTYVRNDFGNKASEIKAEKVKEIRAEVKNKKGFYSPEELNKK